MHAHKYAPTFIDARIQACTHNITCARIQVHTHAHPHMYAYEHTCTHIRMHAHHFHMHRYQHAHTHIYTYTHTRTALTHDAELHHGLVRFKQRAIGRVAPEVDVIILLLGTQRQHGTCVHQLVTHLICLVPNPFCDL